MAQNITLLGASYTDVPAVELPKTGGGTASFTDVTPTTAVATDVLDGKYFFTAQGVLTLGTNQGGSGDGYVWQDQDGYVHLSDEQGTSVTVEALSVTQNGTYTAPTGKAYSPVSVNVSGGGSPALKVGIIRPDAELVQSWTYDKYIVEDEGITIPSYSTTAQTLKESENFTPTYTLDRTNYCYALIYKGLTTPEYSIATVDKGRQEYYLNIMMSEMSPLRALNGDTAPTSYNDINSINQFYRYAGWYNANSYRNTTGTYGVFQTFVPHTYTDDILQIKSPQIRICGNASYFTQTYWNALTDARLQYKFELYRAPKNSGNIVGFNFSSLAENVIDCFNSASGDLT